jgi:hypothetical protein
MGKRRRLDQPSFPEWLESVDASSENHGTHGIREHSLAKASDVAAKVSPRVASGPASGGSRVTFLVGRVTPGVGEVIVMDGLGSPPFPGPWTLRALVRPPRLVPWPGPESVH